MMTDRTIVATSSAPDAAGIAGLRDRALLTVASRLLRALDKGSIDLTLPSGARRRLGQGGTVEADIVLRSFKVVWRAILRGHLGFAESYLRGDVETRDLADVFRFAIDNASPLDSAGGRVFRVRGRDQVAHARRDNTRDGSRRNIADHYDLGNAFYAAWLDRSMTYSSGIYTDRATTLEAAQVEKYAHIMAALDVTAGQRVLEIGCGWGGFAEAAAQAGAHVTGLTLSAEQLAYARNRLSAAGLADKTDIRFEDYRDCSGTFDRIASIEMIEAVGEKHWPDYFETLANRLGAGGTAVLQAITIREESYDVYRERPDFIQRYVFPGGMLPTKTIMVEQARRAGLTCEIVETFAPSYARTLAEWRTRFEAAWPRIAALGFDERFRRMWEFYLTYCEVGFERGVVDVALYRLQHAKTA